MERNSQTKLLLANSLKDLMRKTAFHKITIQMVTDHCGLNRQTFYYHFKDMFDLLNWIYQNEIFQEINNNQDWKSILLITVKYAKKNKAFLRNTNRSLRKEIIEKFMYPFVSKWVSLIFDDACGSSYIRQDDREFLISFFTSAFISTIIQWIGNGMPYDEAYLLDRVQLIRDMVELYKEREGVLQSGQTADPNLFQILNTLRAEQTFL